MSDDYPTNLDTNGNLIYDPRICAKTFKAGNYGFTTDVTYEYVGCSEVEAWQ